MELSDQSSSLRRRLLWALRSLSASRERASVRGQLIWALRWLAAEPAIALRALDAAWINEPVMDRSGYVPDDLVLTLAHWHEVARDARVVSSDALALLIEIDEAWDAIVEPEDIEAWSPEAFATSDFWAMQRQRARRALDLMGVSRADDDLAGNV
jgi:hypothetical protein